MTMNHKVFVYGTLKTGEGNYGLLTDVRKGRSKLIGRAISVEPRPLVVATPYNIPFLLDLPGQGKLTQGELYIVDDQMLAALDELEGHPHVYMRVSMQVKLLNNSIRDQLLITDPSTFDLSTIDSSTRDLSPSTSDNLSGNSAPCNKPSDNTATRYENLDSDNILTGQQVTARDETALCDGSLTEYNYSKENMIAAARKQTDDLAVCEKNFNEKNVVEHGIKLCVGDLVTCETYVLRDFKSSMLDLEFMSDYNGTEQAGLGRAWVPRFERPTSGPTVSNYVKQVS